jgi:hypothetical protein
MRARDVLIERFAIINSFGDVSGHILERAKP